VVAPFTQRGCGAWHARLEVKKRRDAGSNSAMFGSGGEIVYWSEEIREDSRAPFWIVGDDGARVLVVPTVTVWSASAPLVNEDPHVNDENAQLDRYLRSHGVLPTAYMGIAGDTRFYELALGAGEAISVYGDIDEMQGVHAEGYRDAPERIVRLFGSHDAPLVVIV
jgi:hypothetical protein